jgi:hypothetical protein
MTLSSHGRNKFNVTNLAGLVLVGSIDSLENVGEDMEVESIMVRVVAMGLNDRSGFGKSSESILDLGEVVDDKYGPVGIHEMKVCRNSQWVWRPFRSW